ncbi:hypothetical protein FBEOM_5502 [Fusarium beomiforme]|uniref:Uncharacterized protein n=1 Tax=Fusarium beomiforme TaxID=44412 RepID=A0A9P5AKT8_9HYPO|nr:hypothetical protein FBEOM_5502 [Fusarium beomiforme]
MADPRAASSLSAYGRRDGPVTPEPPTRFSYDTAERGEPSMNALLHAPLSPVRPLAFSDDESLPRHRYKSRGAAALSGLQAGRPKRARSRRPHKTQPSSAFLLQEPVVADDDSGNQRRAHRSKSRHKGKDVQGPYLSNGTRDLGLGISSGIGPRARVVSPDTSQEELHISKRNEGQRRGRKAHAPQVGAALDVDSTQIVNMALNLSESRRIASRRNISRGNPPRLAPVQDTQAGSNLRAHLQQQRKAARGASPIPNQSLTPRLPGVRSSSPLRPPPFETTDASYRYHFSTSTLARAQKARDHLELMAQYRRLLQVLPPLKTGYDRTSASSPPGSPTEGKTHVFGSREFMIPLGREYNPLQYIRNRKVRARERMVIDGEKQGFADVEAVKDWVDEASERASRELLSSYGSILPPFPAAEETDAQISTDSAAKVALRVRRPRVDWFFEACDLIADAYWLEQDHHKQLIEDRNLNKIYPQTGEVLSRPISGQSDEVGTGVSPFTTETMEEMNGKANSNESYPLKSDTDLLEPSHRDRARQKLHEMGSFHRQTGSVHHRRFRRRGSSSDDSTSEDDVMYEGKARRGTISSRETELLEKQMMEMVARDMKQQRLSHVQETEAEYMQPEDSISPEPKPQTQLSAGREWNTMDPKGSENRPTHNRASLETPSLPKLGRNTGGGSQRGRNSKERTDSPQPMSPELAPQYSLSAPPTGLQLSAPSSRSSSPSRNPFTKVKQIFKDKTRDEPEEQAVKTEASSRRPSIPDPMLPTETKPLERHPSNSRPTFESHKHQRSVGSIRPKGDDQVGLRGMFKGPRIDTVIRGGVSRLGDMLWKKDTLMDGSTDILSSDESDNDHPKGRSRISLNLSRTNSRRNKPEPQNGAKHFLDSMPQFQPMAETRDHSTTDAKKLQPSQSRADAAITPMPDTCGILSPSKPQQVEKVTIVEPVISEAESCQESVKDGARIMEKENHEAAPMVRFNEPDNFRARKWSIANQPIPQEGQLSKREIARLRTLILASGIKAMEISRRAHELKKPLPKNDLLGLCSPQSNPAGIPWVEIANLTPKKPLLFDDVVPCSDHFRLASQTLGAAIQTSMEQWQTSADKFTAQTRPKLEERIWCVRSRIADELSGMTREASDQADETGKDLALGQLLKVKHVTDLTDKMMRNRRRRFRWLRRGMWSVVEWTLVGFMWYVWFVVTIFRLFLGLGQGVWQGVRWLLWL